MLFRAKEQQDESEEARLSAMAEPTNMKKGKVWQQTMSW